VAEGRLFGEGTLRGLYRKDEAANKAEISVENLASSDKLVSPKSVTSSNKVDEKTVITQYKSLAVSDKYSLICVKPITGRAHQIRAHLASIGFPLAGDKKYGGQGTPFVPAQLLHAFRLTTKDFTWEAELPEGFKQCLKKWFPDFNYERGICNESH